MENIKSLKEQCYFLRKNNSERKDYFKDEFKAQFIRYIGIFEDYESSIKTLKILSIEEKNKWLFFENEIALDQDIDFFEEIRKKVEEIYGMNISNKFDIKIFGDTVVNEVFLSSLDYISEILDFEENLKPYEKYETLATIICLSKQYLSRKKFDYVSNIKCIYFGKIDRISVYFLILLHRMMCDIIYICPSDKYEEVFEKYDYDMLSKVVKSDKLVDNIEKYNLQYISKKGIELRKIKSTASYVQESVYDNLFKNKELYYTNQFIDYEVAPLLFEGVIPDFYNTFVNDVRFREGFKVNEETKIVFFSHFFTEVQGVQKDYEEYVKLVRHLLKAKNTIFFIEKEYDKVLLDENIKESKRNGEIFLEKNIFMINDEIITRRMFYFSELAFTVNEDETYNLEDIKKVSFYNLRNLKEKTVNYIFKVFNEVISTPLVFFNKDLSFLEKTKLLFLMLLVNPLVYKLLERFDYTNSAPKIVIYLDNQDELKENMCQVLTILSMLGIDIIILSPNGKSGLDKYINQNAYTTLLLDEFKDIDLTDILNTEIKEEKEGFFSMILKWKK
jgi:hypothetical protein